MNYTVIEEPTEDQQFRANQIARRNGWGKATLVVYGPPQGVIRHVEYGYRKRTTGQYVPKAYISNFGWKNTFYQCAETVVSIGETI